MPEPGSGGVLVAGYAPGHQSELHVQLPGRALREGQSWETFPGLGRVGSLLINRKGASWRAYRADETGVYPSGHFSEGRFKPWEYAALQQMGTLGFPGEDP